MGHQLVEHVHRQIAIGLQVFHGLLTCTQGSDLILQPGDFLDLGLQHRDLGAQHAVLCLLGFDHHLVPPVDSTNDQKPYQGRKDHGGLECFLASLACGFSVRKQIDQDHDTNLRMARPQAVR